MIEFNRFSKIVSERCSQTVDEFLTLEADIKVAPIKNDTVLEDIAGPSIEVRGKEIHYSCIMQYKADQNLKFLEMLAKKHPYLNQDEVPDLDILDLLGEFLNILCGKINRDLENVEDDLVIEIPYFEYGIDVDEDQDLGALECKFGELSFKLHYILN